MTIARLRTSQKLPLPIVSILLFSFSINVFGIWWGLPSYSGWAIDEVRPDQVIAGAEQLYSNGWYKVYPPFHFYLLTVLYLPFFILNQLGIAQIQSLPVTTTLFYLGRFLSVFMGTATVYIVYLCGREIYSEKASLWSALITALICPFIYFSKTTNLEIPYIFWLLLSLLFYIRILKYQRFSDYLLFAFTAVTSICTKDQAYGFYVLTSSFIILNYYFCRKRDKATLGLIKERRIIVSLLLGIVLFCLYHNFIFNWSGFVEHVKLIVGPRSNNSYDLWTDNNFLAHWDLFRQVSRDILFSFGLPMLIVCLLGLLTSIFNYRQNSQLLFLLIPGVSYYIFFLSIILYSRDRFLLPICIILSFFGGKFIADVFKQRDYFIKAVFVAAIFIYTFFYSFSVNNLMVQDTRYSFEEWLVKNVDKNSFILSLGIRPYLPRFRMLNYKSREWKESKEIPNLDEEKFDYIVTTSGYTIDRFEQNSQEYQFFEKLNNGQLGYTLLLDYHRTPRWNLLNFQGVKTTLNKINPEIKIFQRS